MISIGLESGSLEVLRKRYGYNEVPEQKDSLLFLYLKNFWGPLPWVLEITTFITFLAGKKLEASIIILLIGINAGINIYQQQSAATALSALRKKIQMFARARRDGIWTAIPVRELLPGDCIRLQTGDIVPADALLTEGFLSVDFSMLSGESLPKEMVVGEEISSGGIVRRGEATAVIKRTGIHTLFGKTTELLETSHPPTHMEQVIFAIIKYFFFINSILIVVIIIFGVLTHTPIEHILNFVIVLLLLSVPVAFPSMFAVAQSYGALQLGEHASVKVLVRRLAAIQDGAMMDVVCSDKTGTLTTNQLTVHDVTYYESDEATVLALGGICSNEADSDSIDEAIYRRIRENNIPLPTRTHFEPFNSATKRTEADFIDEKGNLRHVVMGLPESLLSSDVTYTEQALRDVNRFSEKGFRVVAIVSSSDNQRQCEGLIAFSDPVRPDARELIQKLSGMGIRTIMITGDGKKTAAAIATELGLEGEVYTPEDLHTDPSIALRASVFAEAFPEDKINIIRALQEAGHVVGMTGDGVNDAPALRQAEIGIAVANAVDVAKQSASLILTTEGLQGILHMIIVSREVYFRLRTWALNKIIKSIEVIVFTTGIFFMTGSYILSPLFAVLLLFANDFIAISLATDRTGIITYPTHWEIKKLIIGSSILSLVPLLCMTILYSVAHFIGYSFTTLQTIVYVSFVYCGITTILSIRAWPSGFSLRPSRALFLAIIFSLTFTFLVGTSRIVVSHPVSWLLMGFISIIALLNFFGIEMVKRIPLVRQLLGFSS